MRRNQGLKHGIILFSLVLAVLLSAPACQTTDFSSGGGASSGGSAPAPAPSPLYYDFDDVLIPNELNLDKDDCFVYRASGISAGVMVFSGRVDIHSLVTFFENNMTKDNWELESIVRTPKTLMLFRKENRSCVITLRSNSITTFVEIWVAPGTGMAPGSGLLKESVLDQ